MELPSKDKTFERTEFNLLQNRLNNCEEMLNHTKFTLKSDIELPEAHV